MNAGEKIKCIHCGLSNTYIFLGNPEQNKFGLNVVNVQQVGVMHKGAPGKGFEPLSANAQPLSCIRFRGGRRTTWLTWQHS